MEDTVGMLKCSVRFILFFLSVVVLLTFDLKLEGERVVIGCGAFSIWASYPRKFISLERCYTALPSESLRICFDGDKTKPVRKDFILNNRGVIEHKDSFDCHCGDFSNQDPSKGICDRSINSDQIELHLKLI